MHRMPHDTACHLLGSLSAQHDQQRPGEAPASQLDQWASARRHRGPLPTAVGCGGVAPETWRVTAAVRCDRRPRRWFSGHRCLPLAASSTAWAASLPLAASPGSMDKLSSCADGPRSAGCSTHSCHRAHVWPLRLNPSTLALCQLADRLRRQAAGAAPASMPGCSSTAACTSHEPCARADARTRRCAHLIEVPTRPRKERGRGMKKERVSAVRPAPVRAKRVAREHGRHRLCAWSMLAQRRALVPTRATVPERREDRNLRHSGEKSCATLENARSLLLFPHLHYNSLHYIYSDFGAAAMLRGRCVLVTSRRLVVHWRARASGRDLGSGSWMNPCLRAACCDCVSRRLNWGTSRDAQLPARPSTHFLLGGQKPIDGVSI